MAANNINPQWFFGNDPALTQQSRDGLTQMMQYIWSLKNQQANLNQTVQNFSNNVSQQITVVSQRVANIANNTNNTAAPNVLFGTHAQRIATSPVTYSGYFFIETDRNQALYYSNGSQWILIEATSSGSFESRYTGLGPADAGFSWYETSRNNTVSIAPVPYYRWNGANWNFITGQFYRNQNGLTALANTFAANNSNNGNDLGAIVNVIDFAGQLQWTSANNTNLWSWGPEDCRMHGMGPIFAEVDPSPPTGWQLYDGSNNVTYLQGNGNTGTVNLVALSGANASGNTFTAAGNVNSNINAPVAPTFSGGSAAGSFSGSFAGSSDNFNTENFTSLVMGNEALTGPNPIAVSGNISGSFNNATVTGNISNNATPQSLNRRAWFRR